LHEVVVTHVITKQCEVKEREGGVTNRVSFIFYFILNDFSMFMSVQSNAINVTNHILILQLSYNVTVLINPYTYLQ
jgi:hypothetical protein